MTTTGNTVRMKAIPPQPYTCAQCGTGVESVEVLAGWVDKDGDPANPDGSPRPSVVTLPCGYRHMRGECFTEPA